MATWSGTVMKAPQVVRIISGLLLIGFGVFIWMKEMITFSVVIYHILTYKPLL
jgi:hypothetical protein